MIFSKLFQEIQSIPKLLKKKKKTHLPRDDNDIGDYNAMTKTYKGSGEMTVGIITIIIINN